jgi:Helitron helicase-like domain at N-terminus
MNVQCKHCHALHWIQERHSKSSQINPTFGRCCLDGKVELPFLTALPPQLQALYDGQTNDSKHFLEKIRQYNAAFAMASLGVKVDDSVNRGGGPPVYRIHGELIHRLGHLLPGDSASVKYAQVYFLDPAQAVEQRNQNNSGQLRPHILQMLGNLLEQCNVHLQTYRTAAQRLQDAEAEQQTDLVCRLRITNEHDKRRWNLPTGADIAVVVNDTVDAEAQRDIMVQLHSGVMKRIKDFSPFYQPLYYVLLFPNGELGWQLKIPLRGAVDNGDAQEDGDDDQEGEDDEQPRARKKQKFVTQMGYYAFRLHQRPANKEAGHLFQSKSLLQQYICDAWAQTDQARLRWYTFNQNKLRTDIASGLVDHLNRGDALGNLGSRMILPSSYIGGSRNMFQLYQDSLALARFFSKPDFFLTVTANPNWVDITAELPAGQQPSDRPDLIARVFHEKLRLLMAKIKSGALGKWVGHVYTIEFQKRGLPHVHILLFMDPDSRLHTPEMVDQIISAEIPNPDTHPVLHDLVKRFMIHGPCGVHNPDAPCMKNEHKRCSKNFPRSFQEATTMTENGYPTYRRREDGHSFINAKGVLIDNRWVVPYSPFILLLMWCHCNLECCISVKAFKYIHKYVYKGHDRTSIGIAEDIDEIKDYLDARYVSASEATWRLMHYRMHDVGFLCFEPLNIHLI